MAAQKEFVVRPWRNAADTANSGGLHACHADPEEGMRARRFSTLGQHSTGAAYPVIAAPENLRRHCGTVTSDSGWAVGRQQCGVASCILHLTHCT